MHAVSTNGFTNSDIYVPIFSRRLEGRKNVEPVVICVLFALNPVENDDLALGRHRNCERVHGTLTLPYAQRIVWVDDPLAAKGLPFWDVVVVGVVERHLKALEASGFGRLCFLRQNELLQRFHYHRRKPIIGKPPGFFPSSGLLVGDIDGLIHAWYAQYTHTKHMCQSRTAS